MLSIFEFSSTFPLVMEGMCGKWNQTTRTTLHMHIKEVGTFIDSENCIYYTSIFVLNHDTPFAIYA